MAEGGLRIGTFAGAAIIVDWSVALLAGYLILSALDNGGFAALPSALVLLAALLSAILLHEFGHAGVAAALNLPSKRIVLSFMGGHVEFAHPPQRRWHDIAVSAAGPLANLATAGALFLIPPFSAPDAAGGALAIAYLQSLMMISLLLGVFNLLPGFPLDGGRILTAALSFAMNVARARLITAVLGFLIAAATGYWGYVNSYWWTLGVSLLLALAALAEFRFAQAQLRTAQDEGRSNT